MKAFKGRRGIALLLTITVITVLMTIALELNRTVMTGVVSTAATRNRFVLAHMADSGVQAAMAMLIKDKQESPVDSLQEDWADGAKIDEVMQAVTFGRGRVSVTIADELARIQVNSLVVFPGGREVNIAQQRLWENLLELAITQGEDLDELEPVTIVNSLIDWLDSGDDDAITGLSGAESDYYQDMDPPYAAGNGPFVDIEEIALVRGMIPALFSGSEQGAGLRDYLTVHGMADDGSGRFTFGGAININTAELPVIAALLQPDEVELATAIYEYRNQTEDGVFINDVSSPTWYKNAPGCNDLTIDPQLITVSSDLFRIESTAVFDDMAAMVTAVVQRINDTETGKWFCRILSHRMGAPVAGVQPTDP